MEKYTDQENKEMILTSVSYYNDIEDLKKYYNVTDQKDFDDKVEYGYFDDITTFKPLNSTAQPTNDIIIESIFSDLEKVGFNDVVDEEEKEFTDLDWVHKYILNADVFIFNGNVYIQKFDF